MSSKTTVTARRGSIVSASALPAEFSFIMAATAPQWPIDRAEEGAYADVSDDPIAGSASTAAPPPLPPIPPAGKASTLCPRLTWSSLHLVGLSLLHLSGIWSPHLEFPFDAITVLATLTLLLYVAASVVDPGYLPDGKQQERQQQREPQGAAASARLGAPLLELPHCMHCQARQVARAKHCHDCGRCVRRLDHHCWWLGNCVGAGNHRLFVSYLVCEALLLVGVGFSASQALSMDEAARARAAPYPAVAPAAAVSCVGMCATLGLLSLTLLAFQLSLIARGETTWEHLRRERINAAAGLPPHVRPYDRGVWRNLVYFACGGPLPPSGAPIASSVPVDGVGGSGAAAAAALAPTPGREPRAATSPPYGL